LGYRNTKNRGKPRQQDLESLIIFPAAEIGVEGTGMFDPLD